MIKKFTKINTKFKEAFLIKHYAFEDFRGFFKETYRKKDYAEFGINTDFIQDNISWSYKNVLRGMHYDYNVAKLVQVIYGRTYHVIVDMRKNSSTYKQWQAFILSGTNHLQIYVPKGFANGFLTLSEHAWVHYKQDNYYTTKGNKILKWNDPEVGIIWPTENPILSEQDS